MAKKQFIAVGVKLAFWGRLNTRGTFVGTTGSLAAGAAGEAMGELKGIKTAGPGPAEPPDPVIVTGDDVPLGAFDFGPDTLPSWITEIAVGSLDNHAALQGTSVESLGDIQLGVLQPNNQTFLDTCLIYQGEAKSKEPGADGVKQWAGVIVPLATTVPLGRAEYNYRAEAVDRFKMTAQAASKKPWGVTILDSVLGTDGAVLLPFVADNPITMHAFLGNAVLTAFTLGKTPISAAKTIVHVISPVGAAQRLVATTDYTINVSTRTITFNSAPADGSIINVLYEFTP